MLVVTVARGGQGSLSSAECSHVTFLLFKHWLFAPSGLIAFSPPLPFHRLSPLALIFNSVAVQGAAALCHRVWVASQRPDQSRD